MKLRTEMQNGCVHANGYCVDEDAVDIRQAERLVHDAAAANALMMALERWAARRADHASYADHLLGHADEIMAGWGFDSGEDA